MKIKIFVWISLVSFALILCAPLLINGQLPDGRYQINGGHDAFWHLSLIKEITRQFPPRFPGAPDFPLQNYHYLTHIMFAIVPKLTGVSISFLYFKIYNPFLVFGLVFIIFKMGLIFTKNQAKACVVTFITLFSGSAAFLLPYFSQTKNWFGNSFMLDQPYDQLFNLHATFGYILIFASLYFVHNFQKSNNLKDFIFATASAIILVGVKSFFAIPLVFALIVLAIIDKHIKLIPKLFLLISLIVLPYLLIKLISAPHTTISGSVNFHPGWLIQKMMEYSNRVYLQDQLLRQQYYRSVNNIPRLAQIIFYQIMLYVLGNFWIRLLGISLLFRKTIFSSATKIYLIVAILTSSILPLLLTTNPDYFNTIQFGQVAVILSSFLTGIFLVTRTKKFIPVALIIIVVLPITFFHDFFTTKKFTDYYVDKYQVEAIHFITLNSSDNDLFLVNNGTQYEMIIPGLAGRRTYFNGIKQAQLFRYDYAKYLKLNDDFFTSKMTPQQANEFLTQNQIKYIFLLKDQPLLKYYLLDKKVVFENIQYQLVKL